MRNHKRFTQKEDDIITYCIKTNDILNKAFTEAALQLNRTKASIASRYYSSNTFLVYRKDKLKTKNLRKDKVKKILIKEIKKSPDNIQNAIRHTARKTGFSTKTLVNRYYGNDNSYLNRKNIGVCFTLISDKKVIHNSKNTEKHQPNVKTSKTLKLFEFFKKLFS